MIDGDRNQYLDETEFAGIIAASNRRELAGFCGRRSEWRQHGDSGGVVFLRQRDQMTSASRIEVTVRQDGKTLFGLLDANQDRRLSAREVRSGTEVLKNLISMAMVLSQRQNWAPSMS